MQETIDTLLANAGLAYIADQLKSLALPSIRLIRHATQDNMLPPGASKLGGVPDLPPDAQWPTWRGMPLAFVAQINLAEIPVLHEPDSLPSSGLLSFFYHPDQMAVPAYDPASRGGWRVFYYEGQVSQLQRRPIPSMLLDMQPPLLYGHFPTCALTYVVTTTYPHPLSLPIQKLHLSQIEVEAYWEALDTLQQEDHEPWHRLLGHADNLQGDMEITSQLASHGITFGYGLPEGQKAGQLLSGASGWQLLLQFDTDPVAEMCWGIEGRCYYWIQTAALQKRHFGDVWCIHQWM
jgi:uncharacterized protein YwqG